MEYIAVELYRTDFRAIAGTRAAPRRDRDVTTVGAAIGLDVCVGEVRGLGAMLAMELVKDRDPHAPDAELTKALVQRAAQNGLVLLSCGVYGNVIRFLMPLTTSDAIVHEGLDILERSLRELL